MDSPMPENHIIVIFPSDQKLFEKPVDRKGKVNKVSAPAKAEEAAGQRQKKRAAEGMRVGKHEFFLE
jgi:hypothetical protein